MSEGKGMAGGWSIGMWLYVIDGGKVSSLLSHGFYLERSRWDGPPRGEGEGAVLADLRSITR